MSIEGYFDRVISIWYDENTKHTPKLIKEMKDVIRQFKNDINYYHKIPQERVADLLESFNKIYKEIYG